MLATGLRAVFLKPHPNLPLIAMRAAGCDQRFTIELQTNWWSDTSCFFRVSAAVNFPVLVS